MEGLFVSCEHPFVSAMQSAIEIGGMKAKVLAREYLKDLSLWMAYSHRHFPFSCNDMNIDRSLPETHKPLSFDLHQQH